MIYLNKFKQVQIAQATHHQMRGVKQSSLLQENSMFIGKISSTVYSFPFFSKSDINFDEPLPPGDVSYQRSEREKELKQQQQQTQSVTTNVHPQQQIPTPTTPNNIDTIKQQQAPPPNPTLASTINARVRFVFISYS
jgi:hypothetical protein